MVKKAGTRFRKTKRRAKRLALYRAPGLREITCKFECPVWIGVATGSPNTACYGGVSSVIFSSSQGFIPYYAILTSSATFTLMSGIYDEIKLLGIGMEMRGQDSSGIFAGGNSTTLYFANFPDINSAALNFDPVEADNNISLECFAAHPKSHFKKYWKFPKVTVVNPIYSLNNWCRVSGISSGSTGITGQISYCENVTCAQSNKTATKTIAQGVCYIYAKLRHQHN